MHEYTLFINGKAVLNLFSETFYTLPVMICLQLFSLSIAYLKKDKFRELRYFHVYLLASFCQTALLILSVLFFQKKIRILIGEMSINLFAVVEISFFYWLALHVLERPHLKSILKYTFSAFMLYTFLSWLSTDAFFRYSVRTIIPETIVGLMIAGFYFLQSFNIAVKISLFDQPAFWINLGVLFLFSCTLPLTCLELLNKDFVHNNFYFYFINFISYSVLYLFIIRGYLCNRFNETVHSKTNLNWEF